MCLNDELTKEISISISLAQTNIIPCLVNGHERDVPSSFAFTTGTADCTCNLARLDRNPRFGLRSAEFSVEIMIKGLQPSFITLRTDIAKIPGQEYN